MRVTEICQCFRRDITPMAGLAIDDDVLIHLHANLTMARLDLPEIDVEIGAGDKASCMFLRGTNVDQDKALLRHRRGFCQADAQLLNGEQIRMVSRDTRHRYGEE